VARVGRFEDCMSAASEALSLAEDTHEEVRQTVSVVPRFDKYLEASDWYAEAATAFAECKDSGSDDVEVGRAEAWRRYALAMHHGDRAIGRYWDPSSDRDVIVEDAGEAIVNISLGIEAMPWNAGGEPSQRHRWRLLKHSYAGLMHRAKAEKLYDEGMYSEAEREFMMAAASHRRALDLVDRRTQQGSLQTISARVCSAERDAYLSKAAQATGRGVERWLATAEQAARRALEFRPQWTPYQHDLRDVLLKLEQAQAGRAGRMAWIRTIIGYLAGFASALILQLLLRWASS
jgi:hypothetical protein